MELVKETLYWLFRLNRCRNNIEHEWIDNDNSTDVSKMQVEMQNNLLLSNYAKAEDSRDTFESKLNW